MIAIAWEFVTMPIVIAVVRSSESLFRLPARGDAGISFVLAVAGGGSSTMREGTRKRDLVIGLVISVGAVATTSPAHAIDKPSPIIFNTVLITNPSPISINPHSSACGHV